MKSLSQTITEAAAIAAPVFKAQGWKWASTAHRPNAVPTEDDIRDLLFRLLEGCEGPDTYVASGRLKVERDEDDYISVSIEIGWWGSEC